MRTMNPVALFKALADETRLSTLLLILMEQELCVCELMTALGESQPKISRHLAQLRQAELVLDRRQGQWVFYRLNPALPDWVQQLLHTTLTANHAWLADAGLQLQQMGDRPQRIKQCC